MTETWRDVEGYEGMYQVSNMGRVRSMKMGGPWREMHLIADKKGYMQVFLYDSHGRPKSHRVHRLVASAFIPNPDDRETVNHKDGDKANNRADNLEWNTYQENNRHAYRAGLNRWPKKVRDSMGKTYGSITEASRAFGVSQPYMSRVVGTGKRIAGVSFEVVAR